MSSLALGVWLFLGTWFLCLAIVFGCCWFDPALSHLRHGWCGGVLGARAGAPSTARGAAQQLHTCHCTALRASYLAPVQK